MTEQVEEIPFVTTGFIKFAAALQNQPERDSLHTRHAGADLAQLSEIEATEGE